MRYNLFFVATIVLNVNVFAQGKRPVILKSFSDSFTYNEIGFKRRLPVKIGDTIAFGTNYYNNVFSLNTGVDSISVRFDPKLKPTEQSTLVHITSSKGNEVVYLVFHPLRCWFTDDYLKKARGHVQYDTRSL